MTSILNLGEQPVPNTLLNAPSNEYSTYNLSFGFNEEYALGGLVKNIPGSLMYNDSYPYSASASLPTVEHFKSAAEHLNHRINPSSVLEIGSNDGCFIKNFDPLISFAVEPCGNFVEKTKEMGYENTICANWTLDLAKTLPKFDLVFAANCITHIDDLEDAFKALAEVVSENGVVVLEEPWLYKVMKNVAYDQIYFEHSYIFSVSSVSKLAQSVGLHLQSIEHLSDIHGGSLRYYLGKSKTNDRESCRLLDLENAYGMNSISAYYKFGKRVEQSKIKLKNLIHSIKNISDTNIICYGATAKSVTVFNYCDITNNEISCITDTTPAKQGKYSPGSGIPITKPLDLASPSSSVTHVFLGAWNFSSSITKREYKFIEKGGRFITHTPKVVVFKRNWWDGVAPEDWYNNSDECVFNDNYGRKVR